MRRTFKMWAEISCTFVLLFFTSHLAKVTLLVDEIIINKTKSCFVSCQQTKQISLFSWKQDVCFGLHSLTKSCQVKRFKKEIVFVIYSTVWIKMDHSAQSLWNNGCTPAEYFQFAAGFFPTRLLLWWKHNNVFFKCLRCPWINWNRQFCLERLEFHPVFLKTKQRTSGFNRSAIW